MKHTIKKLPKSAVEITIEIPPAEMEPYLQKAAQQISQHTTIPGFRPGKASFEQVRTHAGIGRIWEEAAQLVVPKIVSEIIIKENLQTIGSPAIDVIKLAPENPFIFKAIAALFPEVTLGDYSTLDITKKDTKQSEENIDKVLEDLRKMHTKEVVADRPAQASGDKVVLDMEMSLDQVPLDGGSTKDHSIYMDEDYYVPGIKDHLAGVKKGDTKEFKLKFPKEHYQKMIAGKDVDFKITVKDVYELQKPELNDELAQKVGQQTLVGLRTLIRENLENEAKQKESQRQEIELLEKAIEKTKFSDIPDLLANEETLKMLDEMEHGISKQGIAFTDYLTKIGKTRDQLRLDLAPEAIKRVKVALIARAIAQQQNIAVSDAEVDAEIEQILLLYKNDPEQREQIKSPGAREYLRNMLKNRKVIQWLKEQAGLTNKE